MKKFVLMLVAGLGLVLTANTARADFGCGWGCGPSEKSSFWARQNCTPQCSPCGKEDEAKWRKFWHDYYRALNMYYKRLDRLDWTVYYKYHGYQIGNGAGGCCNCQRPSYMPVYVAPTMMWGQPSYGPPAQKGCCPR
ncbi:MAG TPA: hypothetical protein PKD86_15680 [Gemmatales bacterium]|nr:hypothetical protein [Gemmatales bacterium]HMP60785.1 hypothetical protein [Gemmatales bacterium]